MNYRNVFSVSLSRVKLGTQWEVLLNHPVVFREQSLRCTYHGAERDGPGGVVVDSDEVDKESGAAHHGRDHKGPDEHLLYPSSACIGHTSRKTAQ